MELVNTHHAAAWNGYEGRHWAGGTHGPLSAAAGIEPGHRVLDVGCGTGQTTRMAARSADAGHAAGIDLSAPMPDEARHAAETEGGEVRLPGPGWLFRAQAGGA